MTDELRARAATLAADYVSRHFEMSAVIAMLVDTEAEFLVTGGAMRSALLNPQRYSDLDLIAPASVVAELARLGLGGTTTQYGELRLFWNRLAIDIMTVPEGAGFAAAAARLVRSFDLQVNALAYDPRTSTIFDELGALPDVFARKLRLHRAAWAGASERTIAAQSIRLAKLLYETPDVRLDRDDLQFLLDVVLPQLARTCWDELRHRYPRGREQFVEQLGTLLRKQSEG